MKSGALGQGLGRGKSAPAAADQLANRLQATLQPQKKVTVEEYLREPTASGLLGLGTDAAPRLLLEHIESRGWLHDAVCVADHITAMSRHLTDTTSNTSPPQQLITHVTTTCTDELLSAAFKSPDFSDMLFTNRLLEHLHLIKSEDESVRGRASGGSLLPLLRHAVSRPYFPKGSRQVLQCFLSLPSPKLDPFSDLRHQLLQALYQT